ncbi:hypothetical protein [Botrimarina mediterranea]|uniref:Lipoprotein n=1 Tax=Botrimarina mediterranea TaxID=2528022 RepID=A0A518KBY2_9BACT|nr:hypothetical protein [Botrimarina mediterranea]QDV75294.1 hypothetical protein Spa11_35080 [Botrimarina mediterranea]QDV79963.1 hypothetical protein K2D_35830 [Planctomycetes bacterium K2D]
MQNCEKGALGRRLSAVGLILLVMAGCGYGEVSPMAYEFAHALYTLSNRQSADRIDEVTTKIDAAVAAGEITEREAGWLNDICQQCRNGDWSDAQQAAKRMMRDQVKR